MVPTSDGLVCPVPDCRSIRIADISTQGDMQRVYMCQECGLQRGQIYFTSYEEAENIKPPIWRRLLSNLRKRNRAGE